MNETELDWVTFPLSDSVIIKEEGRFPLHIHESGGVILNRAVILDRDLPVYRIMMDVLRDRDERWRFADVRHVGQCSQAAKERLITAIRVFAMTLGS